MMEDIFLYFAERARGEIEVGWDPMWTCVTVQDARIVASFLIEEAAQNPTTAAKYVHKAVRGLSQRFNDAAEPRDKASWALETAFCYERALTRPNLVSSREDKERWKQMVGYWLSEAFKQDERFTRQQFQIAVNGRPRIISILQQDERNKPLLAALQGQEAATQVHLRELTPPPPKPLDLHELTRRPGAEAFRRGFTDGKTPADYDPDYWLSHVYHREYAEYFGTQRMYRKAIEAWRTAAWLYPRFLYRIAGCEALLECVKQHASDQKCLAQTRETLRTLESDFKKLDASQNARVQACRERFNRLQQRPASTNPQSDCEGCMFRSTPLGQCP